jgi:hypothetical protein
MIDWVAIFLDEEKRDAETESFLSEAVSRASLSTFSRRRSLFLLAAFGFRCLTAGAGGVRAHRGDGKGTEAGLPDSDRIEFDQESRESRSQKSATELIAA